MILFHHINVCKVKFLAAEKFVFRYIYNLNQTKKSMTDTSKSTMSQAPNIDYGQHQETAVDKLKRKAISEPFVPLGIAGLVGALVWGGVSYRNRKGMSTSIFLMRLRVVAQSFVVGAMAIGAGYTMVKKSMKED